MGTPAINCSIYVVGSCNVDLVLYGVDRLPSAGETVSGSAFKRFFGGKGANQAVAAAATAQAGTVVKMIACVGADDFGREVKDYLQQQAVDVAAVRQTRSLSTGSAVIMVDKKGENIVGVNRCSANSAVEFLDVLKALGPPGAPTRSPSGGQIISGQPEASVRAGSGRCVVSVKQADERQGGRSVDLRSYRPGAWTSDAIEKPRDRCVILQLEIPMATVLATVEFCKSHCVFTVMNASPLDTHPSDELFRILALVDVLVVNEHEAATIGRWAQPARGAPGDGELDSSLQALVAEDCVVFVTMGARGVRLLRSGKAPVHQPALQPASVIDSTGAGDVFCGSVAAFLAADPRPAPAAKFSCAAAALSLACIGAQNAAPSRATVDAFLAAATDDLPPTRSADHVLQNSPS